MITAEEVGLLVWALGLIAERGNPYTFKTKQQNLWPAGVVNKEAGLKRLRDLSLITFKIDGAESWTIGYGQTTRQEMELFRRAHPETVPVPTSKKGKRRATVAA
jgi:hypothetical protein